MKSERSQEQYTPNPSSTRHEKLVSIDEIYAQMVLDEIMIRNEREALRHRIDECLDLKDEKTFMKLSKRYLELIR